MYNIRLKGKEVVDENGVARIVLDTYKMSFDIPKGQVVLNAPSEHALVGEYTIAIYAKPNF